MVRKGGRMPAIAQQQQQQQKRGRGRVAGVVQATGCAMPELAFQNSTLNQCGIEALQPNASTAYVSPVVYDLGVALQRMGVLPVMPAASERKFALSDSAQTAYLQQLNSFLDQSYELQQRGHRLWVAEQLELQRGSELAIISPPTYHIYPEDQELTHHQTPTKATQVHANVTVPDASPTGVLMSPQTTSTLLAAAMAGQSGLSPSMTGSAAAQLLSPSALGLHPLLLQDVPQSSKRRLGITTPHEMLSPNGTSFVLEPAVMHEEDGIEHAHLLPPPELLYTGMHDKHMHHRHVQHSGKGMGDAPVVCSMQPGSDILRTMREHMRHHPGMMSGIRTPRNIMMPHSDQLSPLSPADLLVTAAVAPQAACMDMGLLGYASHHSVLDVDMHAELRLEAGVPSKRVRR